MSLPPNNNLPLQPPITGASLQPSPQTRAINASFYATPKDVTFCHPKYVSFTTSAFPQSTSARVQSGVPLGVVLQPFADPPYGTKPLAKINFGATGLCLCDV